MMLMVSAAVSTTGTGVGIGSTSVSAEVRVTGLEVAGVDNSSGTRTADMRTGVGIGDGVAVGAGVSVGKGVAVGAGVSVGKGVAVGSGVGEGTAVGSGVSVEVGSGGRGDEVYVGKTCGDAGSGSVGTRVGSIKTDMGSPFRKRVKMHMAGINRNNAHIAPSIRLLISTNFTQSLGAGNPQGMLPRRQVGRLCYAPGSSSSSRCST
jgi:NDP-sugar pyrophosphorylase family protein